MSEGTWIWICGDVNYETYGGIFARADDSGVDIADLDPVRDTQSVGESQKIGHPWWLHRAYIPIEDLEWSDAAERACSELSLDEDGRTWFERMKPIDRAGFLYESDRELWHTEDKGGWMSELLCGERVLDQEGGDDIRLTILGAEDEFLSDVMGKVEIYCVSKGESGCLPSDVGFVVGRHGASERLLDEVERYADEFELSEEITESLRDAWRTYPLSDRLNVTGDFGFCVELQSVFQAETTAWRSWDLSVVEAADYLVESLNQNTVPRSDDVEEDVWKVLVDQTSSIYHVRYSVETLNDDGSWEEVIESCETREECIAQIESIMRSGEGIDDYEIIETLCE